MGNITGRPTVAASGLNAYLASNDGDEQIDLSMTDSLTVEVDNTNAATITDVSTTYNFSRNMLFVLVNGSPVPTAAITITVPATKRGVFVVKNVTSFDATVTITGQPDTADAVSAGTSSVFSSDGTNVRIAGGGGGASDFISLTDVDEPDYTGHAGQGVRVNSTPDGLEFYDQTLLGLSDAPSSFSGQAGKALIVNPGETATEFGAVAGSSGDALPFTLSPTWRGALVVLQTELTAFDANPTAKITFGTADVINDTDAIFNDGNDSLDVPAGVTKVRVTGNVEVSSAEAATNSVFLVIQKNGVGLWDGNPRSRQQIDISGGIGSFNITSSAVDVVEDDQFTLHIFTDTDDSVTINDKHTWLAMEIIETTDTVPSLRTVVASLPAKWRGARITKSVDQTVDATGGITVTFDTAFWDTDSIADLANDGLVVPTGVSKVRIKASIETTDNSSTDCLAQIQSTGTLAQSPVVRVRATANNVFTHDIDSGVIPVAEGDLFTLALNDVNDASTLVIELGRTYLEMEIVEFNSSTDAPVAYIAVPPEHKGALLVNTSGDSVPSGDSALRMTGATYDTSFDPGDGGPPQRFWLGANWTFVDGDVSTGNDTITETAHGYQTGEGPLRLTTTGTLPTGLSTGTNYWVIRDGANTIQLATSRANALAGTQIDITGTTSGTHTVVQATWMCVPANVSKVKLEGHTTITNLAGDLIVGFWKNGALTAGLPYDDYQNSGGFEIGHASSAVIEVNEGDRLELMVSPADACNLTNNFASTWFGLEVVEQTRNITYPGVTVTPPWRGARVKPTSTLTGVDATGTYFIPFDFEVEDTNGFHDTVTNNTRLTIPTGSGISRVNLSFSVRIGGFTEGQYTTVQFYKNGAFWDEYGSRNTVGQLQDNTITTYATGSVLGAPVVEGDYFEVRVLHETDTTIDLIENSTNFAIEVVETDENAFPPHQIDIFLDKAAYDTDAFPTTAGDPLYKMVASRRFTLGDDFAGSVAHSEVAATGAVTFNVNRNGTKIGEINFANTAQTATFTTTAATTEVFDVGDRLEIDTVANYQALDHIAISLWAWRS